MYKIKVFGVIILIDDFWMWLVIRVFLIIIVVIFKFNVLVRLFKEFIWIIEEFNVDYLWCDDGRCMVVNRIKSKLIRMRYSVLFE